MPESVAASANLQIARFYNRVRVLYPLAEWCFARRRRAFIARINALGPSSLLELGPGPGRHLGEYRASRLAVADVSHGMVEECRRRAPHAEAYLMDGEALSFPDHSFECVALPHVLTVTANPGKMLEEAVRVLKPGGWLAILTYEASSPLLRRLEPLWAPLGRLLRIRADFRLDAHGAIVPLSLISRQASGLLGQFTLAIFQK